MEQIQHMRRPAARKLLDDEAELYSVGRRTRPRYDLGRNFGDGRAGDVPDSPARAEADCERDVLIYRRVDGISVASFVLPE
jgi:hypothetical protein